jgi:membrane associated rhomboid family serine protease
MTESLQVDLRSTAQRRQADDWALVLVAEGLSPTLRRVASHYVVSVVPEECEAAITALLSFDLENAAPEITELPVEPVSSWGWSIGLGVTAAWLWFFYITGDRHPDTLWFSRGSANADLILAGEFWRTVTALTLHSGIGHALGNALFGTLFIGAVFGVFGPGLGALLVVLAGSLGNFETAWFYGSSHSSVGASSAIFGAVGLLAGYSVITRWRSGGRRSQVWAPAAAGLAILAMIGMSERSDWVAHATGLLSGGVLGLLFTLWLPRRPRTGVQWVLGGCSVAIIYQCWLLALA